MYQNPLCLGLSSQFTLPMIDQPEILAKIGFEGFFSHCDRELVPILAERARVLNMTYQSIHAPFHGVADMWSDSDRAAKMTDSLIDCARLCHENEIPIMVSHAWIGFGESDGSNERGIDNFAKVVRECQRLGVTIALENTEGFEYLQTLLEVFEGEKNVGFCFDSGHQSCYNPGVDLLSLYGDRLVATHLNDNLGVRSPDGAIFWHDDLHLLPFDGINDWHSIANKLDACNFDGFLTFELCRESKPNRHENDKYTRLDPIEYLTEVYMRACRVAALRKKTTYML